MIINKIKNYLANPKLKRIGVDIDFSPEEVEEYVKCAQDPIYFIENYVKIITLDKGFIKISLYPFQRDAITEINNNRRVVVKAGRQVGKTTMVVGYILWYILFNEDKTVAILANKAATSREILARIKIAYEALPLWLQQGVRTWNKGDIELENNCRIMATSTASSAIRGFSISLLYLDEFAFVPSNIADEFFTSVYPTISSGTTSKILISSTPNGMNHFYKMWTDAVEGNNGFVAIEANWRQVPGRDEKWAADQRSVLGEQKYLQEMECEFMGSSGTLLNAAALKNLAIVKPVFTNDEGLSVYKTPIEGRNYIIVVDTSRGRGLDYSAFVVVDITESPYEVVATFRNNEISPVVYPTVLRKIGKYYLDAYILVEVNDNGQQISDLLFDDYEYENLISTTEAGKKIVASWSFNNKSVRGVRTTKSVKRLGCSMMKDLIEKQKLVITDFNLISELSTFIAKGSSYEAEEGSHDDLVMCVVLFSWLSNQEIFSDFTQVNMKQKLYEQQLRLIEEESLPMPISGAEEINNNGYAEDGAYWHIVK
jgi:hypothetical protein